MLAACNRPGGVASRRNREMMEVDVAGAPSRHSDHDSALRAPCDVACAARVACVPGPAAEDTLVAVLTAVRDGDDPWVPVRRCGCAHGGDPMAFHRVELVHSRAAVARGAV